MLRSRDGSSIKDVSQILAILFIAFIFSVIAHKAYADISLLSQQHSGPEFWVRLGRYFLANITGG